MTLFRLALVLACLAAAGPRAHAQIVVYDDEGVRIESSRLLPVVGEPFRVTITAPGLEGEGLSGTLFYRLAGSTAYTPIPLTPVGDEVRVELPAEAMTVRGLEVYGEVSDGEETLAFPFEEDPAARPFGLRVFLGFLAADVELAPRQYRMVSVPANIGTAAALNVFTDDFGEPDPLRWRLARWNPQRQAYEEAPTLDDSFADGQAFWLVTALGGSFDTGAAISTAPDSAQTLTLLPGYNQIGTPFAFPVAWDDVDPSGIVGRPVGYDGVELVPDQPLLVPWQGYFVNNPTDRTVTLTVPPREASGARPAKTAPPSYTVRLSAQAGLWRDTHNRVGFAPDALPGRDHRDLAEPPLIAEHFRVSVLGDGTRWMHRFEPEPADGAVWDVEVSASAGALDDGPLHAALNLTEEGVRPAGFGRWLLDRDRGTAVAAGGAVGVTLDRDTPVRRFRLVLGTEAFARSESEGAPLSPVAFGLGGGFPNPFADATTLGYRLAERGRATLEVFDLLGRRVRVLHDGETEAGPHTATWDGRDASGRPVANGVYLARLRTADASATRRLVVLR